MKILKKIFKATLIVVAILAVAWCGLYIYAKHFYNQKPDVESFYLSELPLKTSQFKDDFEEIHRIVMENYSLYQAKHLNMDSLYQTYAALVHRTQNTADYGLAVQAYFSALQCAHAGPHFKMYRAQASPAFIRDSLFVDKPNDYLTQHGFKDKDRIIAINGVPTKTWIDRNEKYSEASSAAWRRLKTARRVFWSLTDTLVNYTLLRGEKDTLHIALPLKRADYFPNKKAKTVEVKILQDSIAYLAINTMMDPVLEDFKAAYPQVKDFPYLIIDIRRNGGGNSGNGRDICKYFIRKAQPHCVGASTLMQPEAGAYQGKIYLLTSPITCSAAESFTIDMKESGNVTLIGEATSGDTGNGPKDFRTKHGIYFRIPTRQPALSPQGFPMEGVGIPPHHPVSQTVADFLRDEDTVLNYAMGLITEE